jgi:hypothetical protein
MSSFFATSIAAATLGVRYLLIISCAKNNPSTLDWSAFQDLDFRRKSGEISVQP